MNKYPLEHSIIIAIDGYSACGKSTLAKELSQILQYTYIDTGAMYRAVTLFFIQQQIDLENASAVEIALKEIEIEFINGCTFLNGENVEEEIRKMYVSQKVSPVATISAVRKKMVIQQQKMGQRKGVILDGRDIGTVVFPNAELKIFLTASPDVRTQRRLQEILSKGQAADFDAVQANLLERDYIDSNRADSPLKKAEDAIVIDNSNLTKKEQLAMVEALVAVRIESSVDREIVNN